MNQFTELFQTLGDKLPLIIIGCIEVIAAIVMIAALPSRSRSGRKRKLPEQSASALMIEQLDRQIDMAAIIVRRSDLMPVAVYGDLTGLMGVTLEQIQTDISSLFFTSLEHSDADRLWDSFRTSDDGKFLIGQQKNGEWISCITQCCGDDKHELLMLRRCTEEHKREEKYEKSIKQVEDENRLKTSFLFRMSHEIRTPLNGIVGMLTLAEDHLEPNDPAMDYLKKANELSGHLLELINDILDMSRIEAGKVELENRAFSLHALGDKLGDMFAETLENKGVSFAVYYEALDVDRVVGDELRISQVIINFLSNAVKFTSRGEVTVTFRQMLIRDGKLDLMVRVHDTGIGMKPEFINRIFRPFEQEDASTTRRFGGTGLGMAISDQLVRLMGGQIVINSLPGVGSDFSVFLSLPIAEGDEAADAPAVTAQTDTAQISAGESSASDAVTEKNAAAANADGEKAADKPIRILLAEDNDINALIAVEILKKKGAEVDVAANGELAVKRFSEMPENYYDAILMDIQMPVMDGHEATRTIRALSRADAKSALIFALSADAFAEDERLSRESGMNGHFTKPINFDELWKTLGEELGHRENATNE